MSLKERYWAWRKTLDRIASLRRPTHRRFGRVVVSDVWRSWTGSVQPVAGHARERADAAVRWLLRAQAATPDDGVSLGYFPADVDGNGWMPSYPETTGYIMQSLLDYARRYEQPALVDHVRAMGRWEADVQMASGAVQGGPVRPREQQSAAVFNTGMVLQGWTALLALESDPTIAEAARRAGEFLVEDQGVDGHFRTHGEFVTAAEIKTYNCLCAWALHRLADLSGEARYAATAVRAAEAAVREQNEAGWFAHNCLTNPAAPLTHTIGYTLQGLLETGLLAGRDDIVAAARRGADAVLARVRPNGYLAARFDAAWNPFGSHSCLTGSAQIAIVAYRFHALTGDQRYREAADRLVDFVKGLQRTSSGDEGVDGALAGSFPIHGPYMTWGYPNWATKYLLDALMLQDG